MTFYQDMVKLDLVKNRHNSNRRDPWIKEREFFSSIPSTMMENLYELYKADFLLYGYNDTYETLLSFAKQY